MKIKVAGRGFFISMKGTTAEKRLFETHNVISINTQGVEDIPFSEEFRKQKNVLVLFFDDAIEPDPMNQGRMFSAAHAQTISAFLKNVDLSRPLIVHCTAGLSRSGAVGQVLNDFFNNYYEKNEADYDLFVHSHRHLTPNSTVRRILVNELSKDWL